MEFILIVLIFGLIAGFLSGLLAVGGGIVIIPVFLYLIPLLGFPVLPMEQITGISSMQVITGSLFAFLSHRKYGLMDKNLLYTVGIGAGFGALAGSILSKFVPGEILLVTYFVVLSVSLLVIVIERHIEDTEIVVKNPVLATISAAITGILSGALGVGGAVLFIPILNHFYGMPIKTSISNVTYIVFITAVMTFLGKSATNQIPFHIAILVVLGAFFGARLGTIVSHKLSPGILKTILITIIVITLIRVFFSII